jgi:transposase-like protein
MATTTKGKGGKKADAETPEPKKRSRTYSDRERAEALAVLDAVGGVVERAAKMSGVPANTLSEWAKGRVRPAVLEEKEEVKAALYDRIETLAGDIVGLMARRIKEDALSARPIGFSSAAVALGVLVDKMEKLKGMPGGAAAGAAGTPGAVSAEERERVTARLRADGALSSLELGS